MRLQRMGMLAVVAAVAACARQRSESAPNSEDCSISCKSKKRTEKTGSNVNKSDYEIPSGAVVGFLNKADGASCVGVHTGKGLVYTAKHCVIVKGLSVCGDLDAAWEGGGSSSCESYDFGASNEKYPHDFATVALVGAPSAASGAPEGSPEIGAKIICATWDARAGKVVQMSGCITDVEAISFTHTCLLAAGQSGTAIFMVPENCPHTNDQRVQQAAPSPRFGPVLVGVHTGAEGGNSASRIPGH